MRVFSVRVVLGLPRRPEGLCLAEKEVCAISPALHLDVFDSLLDSRVNRRGERLLRAACRLLRLGEHPRGALELSTGVIDRDAFRLMLCVHRVLTLMFWAQIFA